MHRFAIVVGALLATALLAAPFVAGARITRNRRRAGLVAVREWRTGEIPARVLRVPVAPEVAWADRYEAVVGAAAQTCVAEIDAAMARFAAAGAARYRYEDLTPGPYVVEPLESIEIALMRLQGGVREPIAAQTAAAYRDVMRDTGRLYHPADLLRILGLEPVAG